MTLNSEELLKHATIFTFNALPADILEESSEANKFNVTVEQRSDGRWAVCYFKHCYNKDLEEQYESLPSNRTDEFKESFRFSLEEAVDIAVKLSHAIKIAGRFNAEEYVLWWRNKQ